MFSIAAYAFLDKAEKNETYIKAAAFVDFAGALTLLALGILATLGQGTPLINSLNTISGVDCGGGSMIAGSIITMLITGSFAAKSRNAIRNQFEYTS